MPLTIIVLLAVNVPFTVWLLKVVSPAVNVPAVNKLPPVIVLLAVIVVFDTNDKPVIELLARTIPGVITLPKFALAVMLMMLEEINVAPVQFPLTVIIFDGPVNVPLITVLPKLLVPVTFNVPGVVSAPAFATPVICNAPLPTKFAPLISPLIEMTPPVILLTAVMFPILALPVTVNKPFKPVMFGVIIIPTFIVPVTLALGAITPPCKFACPLTLNRPPVTKLPPATLPAILNKPDD